MNRDLGFRLRSVSIILCLFFIVLGPMGSEVVSTFAIDEGDLSIQQAEESVSSAFEVVLGAEGAGANVSGLVVELDEAVGLLVEAKMLSSKGLFDEAVEAARLSVEIANGVEEEGTVLKASALAQRDFVFMVSVAGSVVGVPVFLVFMLLVWRRFKMYYQRRILSLKPEVSSDVEA